MHFKLLHLEIVLNILNIRGVSQAHIILRYHLAFFSSPLLPSHLSVFRVFSFPFCGTNNLFPVIQQISLGLSVECLAAAHSSSFPIDTHLPQEDLFQQRHFPFLGGRREIRKVYSYFWQISYSTVVYSRVKWTYLVSTSFLFFSIENNPKTLKDNTYIAKSKASPACERTSIWIKCLKNWV